MDDKYRYWYMVQVQCLRFRTWLSFWSRLLYEGNANGVLLLLCVRNESSGLVINNRRWHSPHSFYIPYQQSSKYYLLSCCSVVFLISSIRCLFNTYLSLPPIIICGRGVRNRVIPYYSHLFLLIVISSNKYP